jgi:hypothetical protein
MNIYKVAITALLATSTSTYADSDVYEFLTEKNVYNRAKKDAIEANKGVFFKYEKQTSKKIIVACIESAVTYSVKAQWNLKIASKFDAEEIAESLCRDSGAFGAVLLGYKVKREIKF